MFGRATITLGIVPHSSFICFSVFRFQQLMRLLLRLIRHKMTKLATLRWQLCANEIVSHDAASRNNFL